MNDLEIDLQHSAQQCAEPKEEREDGNIESFLID
jgi:hypothetical protein